MNVSTFLSQAQQLNKDIFETIYYNALKASAELAEKEGPYETYNGSPVSKVYNSCPCDYARCIIEDSMNQFLSCLYEVGSLKNIYMLSGSTSTRYVGRTAL